MNQKHVSYHYLNFLSFSLVDYCQNFDVERDGVSCYVKLVNQESVVETQMHFLAFGKTEQQFRNFYEPTRVTSARD